MTAPYHDQEHLISLNKFDSSIESVICRGVRAFARPTDLRSMPVIIELRWSQWSIDDEPLLLRFLQKLAKHQSVYSVRFLCHKDWAVRAEVIELFYTDTQSNKKRSDLVWDLSVGHGDQIGVDMKMSCGLDHQAYLTELSKQLTRPVIFAKPNIDHFCYRMKRLPLHVPALKTAQENTSQFHLLMIPKRDGKTWTMVPVRTLSYDDSHCRSYWFKQQLISKAREYFHIFTQNPSVSDLLMCVIDLIRDHDEWGKNNCANREVYRLAEILLSVVMLEGNARQSHHDVILFDITNEETRDVTTYQLPFNEMYFSEPAL